VQDEAAREDESLLAGGDGSKKGETEASVMRVEKSPRTRKTDGTDLYCRELTRASFVPRSFSKAGSVK
jgi:hypothetical protein